VPNSGKINEWSFRSRYSGAEYELRILRPARGLALTFRGVGDSES
jgi:hypothetical protein